LSRTLGNSTLLVTVASAAAKVLYQYTQFRSIAMCVMALEISGVLNVVCVKALGTLGCLWMEAAAMKIDWWLVVALTIWTTIVSIWVSLFLDANL
jgi:hypothetical protein